MKIRRGALIGCGFFAENHLHAWNELQADLVAVCDLDGEKARAAASRHGVKRHYTDAEQLFRNEQLDFVDIATTVRAHRPLVEMAARFGVAVICQKPFADSLADADAMIAACATAGVPLMVHENFRWQKPMLSIRSELDRGAIGEPFFGRISFRHDFNVYRGQPYLAKIDRFAILDVGVHLIDLARFFFGDVRSLSCTTQSINPIVAGEDAATILLEHENGGTCVVDASFFTHARPATFPQTRVELDGTRGSIRLSDDYQLAVSEHDTVRSQTVAPLLRPWMERPWQGVQESVLNTQRHWLECLDGNREPSTSGRDNRKTLEIGLLAYAAASTGKTIHLPAAADRTS